MLNLLALFPMEFVPNMYWGQGHKTIALHNFNDNICENFICKYIAIVRILGPSSLEIGEWPAFGDEVTVVK